ncbi:MAG: LLM class flavin-dependent oxidoreductase [Actinomycetota bacterium]|jgi:alkanesulfonate monooxygenase SsuD/methylene tetrahydromethanopterin reductase-like flavin-dependent oxidoreductase (luciferase family)|nr:LLM class flavin-dependent oxidoreductase [Actinomycetota bacterium]
MTSEPLRFGLMHSFEAPARFGATPQQVYADGLEQLAAADALGFAHAWLTEHHFFDDGYCPSPIVAAGALAALTSRIRICFGITLLPLHGNPMRFAEDIAVLDNISGGRVEVGVGQGYREQEYRGLGIAYSERRARYLEAISIVERALAGDTIDHEGEFWRIEDATITPPPVQRPFPPLWIGAATPQVRRRVASQGQNLLISLLTDLGHTRAQFNDYRSSLLDVGRDPGATPIALIREFWVADTADRAWEQVGPHLRHTYQTVYAPPAVSMIETAADGTRRAISDPNDPFFDSDRFWRDRFIIGDPDWCVAELVRFRDELGLTDLVLRIAHPGMAHERVMGCLDRLAAEVIPRVNATPRRQPGAS